MSLLFSTRIFNTCHLCHCKKMLSRNMSFAVSEQTIIPKHLSNLTKQLNLNKEALAKVINKHHETLKSCNESQWLVLFQYLSQYDFNKSALLEMIDSNPEILNINRNRLHKCMFAWNNFRFDDKKLRQLIISQPSCLLLEDKQILSRIPKLMAYVGNKQNRLLELISYSPNVLFDNWKELESKLDYILLNMELGPTQFVNTSIMSFTLEDVKCRHNFLVKLGIYKNRDPKSNLNQQTGNPTLKKIVETSDKQFAVKIAGVTAEEFFVFKRIFKKQLDEEIEDNLYANEYEMDQ